MSPVVVWRKALIYFASKRSDLFLAVILVGFFVVIYFSTAARMPLGYADAEDLALAGYFSTAAHPPGYPLLGVLLHHLHALIPFLPMIFLGSLTSVIFQAINAGLLYMVLVRVIGNRLAAVLGVLWWGVSTTVWLHGTVLEVFPLATTLVLLTLLAWLQYQKTNRFGYWIMFLVLSGFSFLQHQLTLTITFPLFLYTMFKRQTVRTKLLAWTLGVLGFCGIIFTGLYLGFNDKGAYGWPFTRSPLGLMQFFFRRTYASSAIESYSSTMSLAHILQSLLFYGRLLWFQWGPAVALLGVGLWSAWKRNYWYLFIFWILSAWLLVIYLRFPPLASAHDVEYFWGVALRWRMFFGGALVEATFIGLGVQLLLSFFLSPKARILFTLLMVIIFGGFVVKQWPHLDSRESNFTEHYSRRILETTPENSVILVDSDFAFTLLYQQLVAEVRSDLLLVPVSMPVHDRVFNELQLPKNMTIEAQRLVVIERALTVGKRVFLYNPEAVFLKTLGVEGDPYFASPHGYLLEISRTMPGVSTVNDYGLSKQLTDIPAHPHAFWYAGQRAHLGAIHATLAYFYARLGLFDPAKVHTAIALELSTHDLSKRTVQHNLQDGLLAFQQQGSYAYYQPTEQVYLLRLDEARLQRNTQLEIMTLRKLTLLYPDNEQYRNELIQLLLDAGRMNEVNEQQQLKDYYAQRK